MVHYLIANLLDSEAEALVNTVNTVGVMGKGIALQFKNQFPNNFKLYANACKANEIRVGSLFVTEENSLMGGRKIIINFPTKTDWRKPSEYSYIESGLIDLVRIIKERNIKSVAIPPLGAGNGGLDWNKVKTLMENITGYSSKDKKPFEELGLMLDAEKDVSDYLDANENKQHKEIVLKTKQFLTGFYADFGLELLSTVDFIITDKKTKSVDEITKHLENWSKRKKTMFTNPKFISIAVQNIEKHLA